MTLKFYILAVQGDTVELLVVLSLLAVSAIAAAFKKSGQKRQREKTAREIAQHRQRLRQQPQQAQTVDHATQYRQAQQRRQQYARRQAGPQGPLPARSSVPASSPPPEESLQAHLAVNAAREASQMRLRRQQEAQALDRLKQTPRRQAQSQTPGGEVQSAVDAYHVYLPGQAVPPPEAGWLGDLTNRQTLAAAIVYYEIFSPPKALRPEPEPWAV